MDGEMTDKETIKSAQHHWWPRCVSKHWAGSDGGVSWIAPSGECKRLRPSRLGALTNGHVVEVGASPGERTRWDTSFEHEFSRADARFPNVIDWLKQLDRVPQYNALLQERFVPQICDDQVLTDLVESVVSLVIRSPMNREASYRWYLPMTSRTLSASERNAMSTGNMLQSQRMVADHIGVHAKFAVLFAPEGEEFVFGDGFFSTVSSVTHVPTVPSMLVPITPEISVAIVRPFEFLTEPKLFTLVLTSEEVERCNQMVQGYAKNFLFFRSKKPDLTDAFTCGEHRVLAGSDNPIERLMEHIPGVVAMWPYGRDLSYQRPPLSGSML